MPLYVGPLSDPAYSWMSSCDQIHSSAGITVCPDAECIISTAESPNYTGNQLCCESVAFLWWFLFDPHVTCRQFFLVLLEVWSCNHPKEWYLNHLQRVLDKLACRAVEFFVYICDELLHCGICQACLDNFISGNS